MLGESRRVSYACLQGQLYSYSVLTSAGHLLGTRGKERHYGNRKGAEGWGRFSLSLLINHTLPQLLSPRLRCGKVIIEEAPDKTLQKRNGLRQMRSTAPEPPKSLCACDCDIASQKPPELPTALTRPRAWTSKWGKGGKSKTTS